MRNRLWMPLLLVLLAAGPVSADPPALDLDVDLDLDLDAGRDAAAADAGLEMPKERTPTPRGVGYHDKVEAFHDKEVTYKLYVPQQYAEAEAPLPLLVVQNPGGNPNVKRYQPWADEHGVIVVGINKVRNSMPQHDKGRYWNGVLKDFETIGLRVHPQLKFTIGMSGGSADGERMTRGKGKRFAGLVLQGAGRIPTDESREHFAVAVLFGALDPLVNIPKTYEQAEAARESGMPIMLRVYPRLEHDWAPLEDQFEALTWLLHTAGMTHPYIGETEKNARREAAEAELKAIAARPDPSDRIRPAELLLTVPPLQGTEAWEQSLRAYVAAAVSVAAAVEDDFPTVSLMLVSGAKAFVTSLGDAVPGAVHETLDTAVAKHAAVESARREVELRQRFDALLDRERRAGRDAAELRKIAEAYRALESDLGDDNLALDVAEARQGLEKWLGKHGGS